MLKILFFLLLMLRVIADDFEQAVDAYRKGDYIQALNTFYTLAKDDDAKAQYNVGLMYANGFGVQKDVTQAKMWYEKAAKQGNGAAQYNLAQMFHILGTQDPEAYKRAKYWYEKAIEAEIKEANNNLGTLFLHGQGVEENELKAFALFQKGAKLEDAMAQVNMAILYIWGKKVAHDKLKGYENLKKALQAGRSEAGDYLDKLCKQSAWVCKE